MLMLNKFHHSHLPVMGIIIIIIKLKLKT